jgi:hypothetical protein
MCSILEGICGIRNPLGEKISYATRRDLSAAPIGGEDEIFGDTSLLSSPWNPANVVLGHAEEGEAAKALSKAFATATDAHRFGSSTPNSNSESTQQPFLAQLWAGIHDSFEKHRQFDSKSSMGVVSTVSLAFSAVFSELSRTFISHVQTDLKSHELPRIDGNMHLKVIVDFCYNTDR